MSLRVSMVTASVVLVLSVVLVAAPSGAHAAFGISELSAVARNRDGSLDVRAGSHPFQYTVTLKMNLKPESSQPDPEGPLRDSEGTLRDVIAELPAGLIGNPQAVPSCPVALFNIQVPICPGNTQIGVARAVTSAARQPVKVPLYNLTPPLGAPAMVGFSIVEKSSFQEASLRPGDYGVNISDVTVPTNVHVISLEETIWGVPMETAHDAQRVCQIGRETEVEGCRSELKPEAFLSLPAFCGAPLKTTFRVDSVQEPGVFVEKTALSLNEVGMPQGLIGCDRPPFAPSIASQPETNAADSPTGLAFHLHIPQAQVPQNGDPEGTATTTAPLRDTTVFLPAGLTVNPSVAAGLGACSEADIGYEGVVDGLQMFSESPAQCPSASRIGTVAVTTPLLDHAVSGSVYIARQAENPFGSLVALYLTIEDPQTGVVVKLAGKVEPDASNGQLRATFANNPQLPVEDLTLEMPGGPRAPLTTPLACGTYATQTELVPWTSPEGPTVFRSDSFSVDSGANGGSCPSTESAAPNKPSFEAGTTVPLGGTYSPFVLKVSRENGSQRIGAIEATLPLGLVGKLAGVPYCSNSEIAAAAARNQLGDGALEQAKPSCPAASEVGTVTVGAGSGTPFVAQGNVYLAGPYKGAPLSLVIITPAVAGPFDLGVVAVRTALYLNEFTTQIHAVSDSVPSILDGIPLDIRSINLNMNRPEFTLNPTSCNASVVLGSATSTLGNVASLQSRFQVGGCNGLEFKPQLKLSLKGATKRAGHPALRAEVTYPKGPGYANIARAQVGLPSSEFLDQGNLNKVCKQADLRAGTCPKTAIYGKAKAWSPLLDKPLEGPVYLGVGFGYKLPALVAELNGQVRILLKGKVDTTKEHGIRATFEAVPDAPVERFVLEMKGGKKYGLLENSKNICAKPEHANAAFTAQNGKVEQAHPVILNSCRKAKGHKKPGK